jgi:hypothetical protein
MQEDVGMAAIQRDAYRRGGEVKRVHMQVHRVLQGTELLVLSGDYAQLLLFKELQRSEEIANLHERAGLRIQAFGRGYRDGPQDGVETISRVDHPGIPRRKKSRRRGKHRSAAHHGP